MAQNASGLAGKTLFDATNNFGGLAIHNLAAVLEAVPSAQIYRALNTLGWEIFGDPGFNGIVIDLFYCSPEGPVSEQEETLIKAIGLRPIRAGGLEPVELVD